MNKIEEITIGMMKKMKNITSVRENISHYPDNELLLIVDNTEFLYNIKANPNLIEILKHLYKFTKKQEEILRNNIFETLDIG